MSIYNGIQDKAQQMAAKAKDGKLVYKGETYIFTFDHDNWLYVVKDSKSEDTQVRLNTKSLAKAKAYFKEWMEN